MTTPRNAAHFAGAPVMRAPRMEDAAAVAELTSENSPEPFSVTFVEREWTEPGFDLEHDARLLEGAYAAVWDGRGGKAWLDFQGPPPDELFAWAEGRAREKGLLRALAGSGARCSCSRSMPLASAGSRRRGWGWTRRASPARRGSTRASG